MTTPTVENEDGVTSPTLRRRRVQVLVAGLVIAVIVLAGAAAVTWRAWAADHPTLWSAIDSYTAAVGAGDRDALESVVAEGPTHDALVARHAGRPSTATTVSVEMMVSAVWWSVEVRYELPGQPPSTERLLVGPRDDNPDRQLDYAVTAAPVP